MKNTTFYYELCKIKFKAIFNKHRRTKTKSPKGPTENASKKLANIQHSAHNSLSKTLS